jgi:hypothetical protein
MSKLVFQFRKNKYKKIYDILKNGFAKSILKNIKKKIYFFKARCIQNLMFKCCKEKKKNTRDKLHVFISTKKMALVELNLRALDLVIQVN